MEKPLVKLFSEPESAGEDFLLPESVPFGWSDYADLHAVFPDYDAVLALAKIHLTFLAKKVFEFKLEEAEISSFEDRWNIIKESFDTINLGFYGYISEIVEEQNKYIEFCMRDFMSYKEYRFFGERKEEISLLTSKTIMQVSGRDYECDQLFRYIDDIFSHEVAYVFAQYWVDFGKNIDILQRMKDNYQLYFLDQSDFSEADIAEFHAMLERGGQSSNQEAERKRQQAFIAELAAKGAHFDVIPEELPPGTPYTTPLELSRSGITKYSRNALLQFAREGVVPAYKLAGQTVFDATGVEMILQLQRQREQQTGRGGSKPGRRRA